MGITVFKIFIWGGISSVSLSEILFYIYEPPHGKTNKMNMRPAKTRISLGICPVWSESLLCAQWVVKDPSFLHADSEDWSDWAYAQADLSLRWAHNHIVGFVMKWLILLAHLSRRLTRWAYSIPMVCRPSVSVVVHTFKLEYLWSQLANLDQILCVASLGWGKGCIRFGGRLDENSGFYGNRKPPLTYNGENDVSTFSRLFYIWSFLYLQITRTCIKSQTSSHFGQIGPLTIELAAIECLKNFP